MAASISLDLRKRVVAAYRRGGMTYARVAEVFSVGEATVSRLLRLERETGSVAPRAHGGGRVRRISREQEREVERVVLEHPDWSEAELAEFLREHHGIVASDVTVGRTVRRLGYSVKKRLSSRRKETEPTCADDAERTPLGSDGLPLRVWFLWTKPVRTSR